MDLSALENIERVTYTVHNLAGDELGTGWLDVDVAQITQGFLLALQTFTLRPPELDDAGNVTRPGQTAEEGAEELAAISIAPIHAWDLTRGDTPVPVTVAEYLRLPLHVVTGMGEAMGAVTSPKARSGATSAGGSRPGPTT